MEATNWQVADRSDSTPARWRRAQSADKAEKDARHGPHRRLPRPGQNRHAEKAQDQSCSPPRRQPVTGEGHHDRPGRNRGHGVQDRGQPGGDMDLARNDQRERDDVVEQRHSDEWPRSPPGPRR